MKAVRLHAYGQRPKLEEVADPKVTGPHDIIVRIGGAGLCRTDLHIVEGQWKDKSHVKLPISSAMRMPAGCTPSVPLSSTLPSVTPSSSIR